ncbi:chemical-damaging agent resistance protein C [Vibrio zhanjiangensis]|uniref:Chemical-damaging agent resistance protein C n=1 Tax=Vibrio zhanjiangensis TaxID=1046128 RepID=A0ABQ6F376_9VIBR|nr:TerD family protein [Vibrio zhanjiangensis]GLT19697.1 chemical-damaging agent resistance protein C [Vibrio zhanjiangensis]
MAINLEKGSAINLTKTEPSLKKLRLGLGWDLLSSEPPIDIDCCVFICKYDAQEQPKLLSDQHFVFYNNLKCPQGAVEHLGDNRTGAGDGDDETITIDLQTIEPNAQELSFFVTIHNDSRGFSHVNTSYIKMYNELTGNLIAEYKLGQEFANESAVQVGSLIKNGSEWEFHAVGAGYQLGLGDIVAGYQ